MTHCLVLGARGKLGQSLLACARARGLSASAFQGDIADPDDVARALDDVGPDCVVNAAAFTAVDRCESEQERCFVNLHVLVPLDERNPRSEPRNSWLNLSV